MANLKKARQYPNPKEYDGAKSFRDTASPHKDLKESNHDKNRSKILKDHESHMYPDDVAGTGMNATGNDWAKDENYKAYGDAMKKKENIDSVRAYIKRKKK